MDRRQVKTRKAIFEAFINLITEKNYNKITIQEIIDEADIGRSTFYSHFQTKDELLMALCQDIFHHILETANDAHHTHGHQQVEGVPNSVICHMLQHIKENDHKILTLLSCEGNEFFLKYFKENLNKLMFINFIKDRPKNELEDTKLPPQDFLLNHISGSFVEMIQWWIKNGMKESPEELDAWFSRVITCGC
ncbi:MAG: TetR/AcrR family transcriptional regulator [Treponemataceae bacterium]|nr:TetR/AcrR family transcriptional regulator [Treponemataceae bacterium]